MALHKVRKYLGYPKMFPFCGNKLDGTLLLFFLLLPDKEYWDDIKQLQYRVAKMKTKSEMHVKYAHVIYLWEKIEYTHRLLIKTAQWMNQKWSIFKTLSLIFTKILTWTLCMHACRGYQDLFGTNNHGYSISYQSYDVWPHLRKLDFLDFTLSHIAFGFL